MRTLSKHLDDPPSARSFVATHDHWHRFGASPELRKVLGAARAILTAAARYAASGHPTTFLGR